MNNGKPLLFELGTEELPPKTLVKLSQALLEGIKQGLRAAELDFTGANAYATPRRLAVLIENLALAQPDKCVEKRGPALAAAFASDGTPSKAALGFAASCHTTIDQLERLTTDKGEWLSYTQVCQGQSTEQLIPDIIRQSIAHLPIAKRMRWGNFTTEFVRPVHWAVLLWGDQLIETEILGLHTGNITRGHRFHAPNPLVIQHPEQYERILYEQGKVIADIEHRKTLIKEAALHAATAVQGIAHIDDDLLEEIAALNEWPVPITGHFDERFLALPAEVLITTMQTNQKYFPVKQSNGHLLAYFITFSNIASKRPESIQHGNERVVTPRLADAEFFWNQDRKKTLASRFEQLQQVVFQEKLGTLAEKSQRVATIAVWLAERVHGNAEYAKQAALLAKTDLMTEMVGEFGNLQGLMGRYYALLEGQPADVAQALEEQYFPKQSGSPTAASVTGQVLAIAEKMDTLVGIFSAGLIPTGDKDPYALRRAALGCLRTLIENQLVVNLVDLIQITLAQFSHPFDVAATELGVTEFMFERLKSYCLEQGYSPDEIDAVMTVHPPEPLDFMQRLQAVKVFRQLPEAASLAAANKRIRNILKKSDTPPALTISGLQEPQEQQLLVAAHAAALTIQPLLAQRDYQATLTQLAGLRDAIDAFFDHVMVLTEDLDLRASRLALVEFLSAQFLTCADISKLQS
ncbi:MAG: glycine--tRNA ligase subunit beta [Methylovulum sp.]|jgi:glycyl-tRNA synthetase beta chain|nr:glycine--tRNA ligase subunit beta [Methylovulum sp.]